MHMICAWTELLNLIPIRFRSQLNLAYQGTLQEIRLRINEPPELVTAQGSIRLEHRVTRNDLDFCVNLASSYSPWSATTIARGYVTAAGGHRIGICGEAICQDDRMQGVRTPSSLCIRVARDITNIAPRTGSLVDSVLIIGKPGSGKTTLIRDMIRLRSDSGKHIAVVDEREEIFPRSADGFAFPTGSCTDILSGCPKRSGIDAVLRCMGPEIIAVDEITSEEDCQGLLHAGWCGVSLMATAHASNMDELRSRPIYRPIITSSLFSRILVLQADKTWREERIIT